LHHQPNSILLGLHGAADSTFHTHESLEALCSTCYLCPAAICSISCRSTPFASCAHAEPPPPCMPT
jgi:hypothetical protein